MNKVKFIQIACCGMSDDTELYGLDADGHVWMYAWKAQVWRMVPDEVGDPLKIPPVVAYPVGQSKEAK